MSLIWCKCTKDSRSYVHFFILIKKSFLPFYKLRIVHPFWVKTLERIPIGEHLARTIDQKSSGKTQSRTDT